MILAGNARFVAGTISTDDIIPARYKHMYTKPEDMAPHAFENRFPGLAATFREGDIIVGTELFGIGSSREQAVTSLMALGVKALISPQFGRIFYRNCWNLGIPAIEMNTETFLEGRPLRIDLRAGTISADGGQEVEFPPPPPKMMEMLDHGGLLSMILKRAN